MYLPDLPQPAYQDLLETFEREFTYAFGGCTLLRSLQGSYLSHAGLPIRDRINLIYTDCPFSIHEHFEVLSQYSDQLRTVAFRALEEETILVVVHQAYHSQ